MNPQDIIDRIMDYFAENRRQKQNSSRQFAQEGLEAARGRNARNADKIGEGEGREVLYSDDGAYRTKDTLIPSAKGRVKYNTMQHEGGNALWEPDAWERQGKGYDTSFHRKTQTRYDNSVDKDE